jgi:hypothetical protein
MRTITNKEDYMLGRHDAIQGILNNPDCIIQGEEVIIPLECVEEAGTCFPKYLADEALTRLSEVKKNI